MTLEVIVFKFSHVRNWAVYIVENSKHDDE